MENRAKTTESHEAPRRFLFDQSFDVARKNSKKKKQEDEPPPEPTFSRDELEAARQDGYAQGRVAGSEEAASGIDAEVTRHIAAIREHLPLLSSAQAAANERALHDGVLLTTTIARKLLPAYLARHGLDELTALITQCLQTLIDQPKIIVRVGEPYVAAIAERLETAASESAFDGRFLVEADGTMGPSDCRITWQGGGLERREAEIWRHIETATTGFLAKLEGNAADSKEPGTTPDNSAAPPEIAATSAPASDIQVDDGPTTTDDLTTDSEAPTGLSDPLEDR